MLRNDVGWKMGVYTVTGNMRIMIASYTLYPKKLKAMVCIFANSVESKTRNGRFAARTRILDIARIHNISGWKTGGLKFGPAYKRIQPVLFKRGPIASLPEMYKEACQLKEIPEKLWPYPNEQEPLVSETQSL